MLKKDPYFLPTVLRAPRELTKGGKVGARHSTSGFAVRRMNHAFLYDQSLLAFSKGPTYPEMQILGRKRRTKRVQLMSDDFSLSDSVNVAVGRVKLKGSESPAHPLVSWGDRSP